MSTNSMSRRRFLQSTGAAALWLPTAVKGHTSNEMQALFVDGVMQEDVSKWELDTPALCVDLDVLEANIAKMQSTTARNGIASRPHAKTHKTPIIAQMQLDSGSVGICSAKVSEAEAMFQHGIEQILMTTTNVTPTKIRRAMNLRESCEGFIQATDSPDNARLLSAAAESMGIVADIVVDIDPGGHRTGITPGQPALQLAQLIDSLPGLRLRGLLCYDGGSQHVKGFEQRKNQTLERLVAASGTYDLFQQSGLSTEIFSGGGTGTYNIDHETRGLTDIQVGSYVFMDAQYIDIGGESDNEAYDDFGPSLTILATVLNAQYEGRATTDAGAKSCTINRPWPVVKGETGMSYTSGSDEFGSLRYEDNASRSYEVGDKLELIVSHCDPVVNLYNQMYAIRDDRVEAIWPIAARGMSA
ncbi:MAG: alanine racemase [Gammaproteobacteria bacterium]|nr:alanine racemase [Gammaproteobacteria bacterium]MDP6095125.1 DSD1 family PLP-dependent enzyme [Gammaproteobacteria bacterium]MDP7356831.1 DSD1 family PLP-dependent enzyme [Pseudomonadales bacterium]HJN95510.1 DSD1 family PLP-dependent enzyme [Gammaproteobacteria bacterium]